jgi:hypothetical protein
MPAQLTMIHTDAITPARAREALKAVAALNQPAAPDHWAVVVLREVLRQFEKARQGKHAQHEYECPGIGGSFSAAFASDHLARCPAHFAVQRARAVADAIRLAPEVVAALDLPPVKVDPAVLDEIGALAAAPEPRWARRWFYLPDDAGLLRGRSSTHTTRNFKCAASPSSSSSVPSGARPAPPNCRACRPARLAASPT